MTSLSIYIGLAVAFGVWVWFFHGSQFGVEFFAGWLTEYSLSVDNLFIFLIIMASFNVPKKYQQQALLVGIILALDLPRHLHRARRGGDQPVLLGLLHFRRVPASTPRSTWSATPTTTTTPTTSWSGSRAAT